MELFIAIQPEPELAQCIHNRAADVIGHNRLEEPEALHVTLQYLGETDRCNEIMKRLSTLAAAPFELSLGQAACFYNDINVIHQRVTDGDGSLRQLEGEINSVLADLNLASQPVDYVPHITLSYSTADVTAEILEGLSGILPRQAVKVSKFSLFRVTKAFGKEKFQKIADFRLSGQRKRKSIHLLCINDFHSALRENKGSLGCAKLAAAVKQYKENNPDTLVVFGGDNYFGDPVSELYGGEPVNEFMNYLGAEVSVMGNHDYDCSLEQIKRLNSSGTILLAANLRDKRTGMLPGFVSAYAIKKVGDFRVALVGISTKEPMANCDRPKEWEDYEIAEPGPVILETIKQIRQEERPDAIILLAHVGLRYAADFSLSGDELKELCLSGGELDGIFCAHWHQFMQTTVNNIPVAQGGSLGRGFAAMTLTFDESHNLLSTVPECYDYLSRFHSIEPDCQAGRNVERWFQMAKKDMQQVIAVSHSELYHRSPIDGSIPIQGSRLSALVTRVMMEAAGTKISMFYAGRLGKGFPAGEISLYDFYDTFMFENTLVRVNLTGRQLKENLEKGLCSLAKEGKSPLAVGGIHMDVNMEHAYGQRIVHLWGPQGETIQDDRQYDIAIEDYLASDPFDYCFRAANDCEFMETSVRKELLRYLKKKRVIDEELPANIHKVEDTSD